MRKIFINLPKELKEIISYASEFSKTTGMSAYLVGGCLRDLILQVKNLDLDIAIEGNGIIFAQELAQKIGSTLKIHQRFKTATLVLTNGLKVDIATLRRERYPYPAALPVVSPGSLSEDLMRRDFTINAMAISLVEDNDQGIIDPYGGQTDLAAGRIRILHNLSFKDDPTRIFRAVRFSQRFNFKIEPETLALLKRAISEDALDKVNSHRMREELTAILKEQNPFGSLSQLGALGALTFISSKLKINRSVHVLFNSVAKEITWFVKNFSDRRRLESWLIYFAGLLEPLTLFEINRIIHRLGLTKKDRKRITDYYQAKKKIIPLLSKKQITPKRIFLLLEPLSDEAIILISAVSSNKNLKKHLADFLKIYSGIRLCVSGVDLGNLGVAPGPEYRKMLNKVLAAKLNGQLHSRDAELALIKKLVQSVKKKRSV